jgi:predicted AAA+ superfamily ATPase
MEEYFTKIAKYNFWNVQPKLGYLRQAYLDNLLQYKKSKLIKVLVGQRRVGKSYILRQYISKLIESGVNPTHTLYINKEFTDYDFISNYKDLDTFIQSYKNHFDINGKFYLFIDEVQQIEDWEKSVNSFSQDFTIEVDLFITGSNSQLLAGELSTLLSGRYIQFLILAFNFEEYIGIRNLEANRSNYLRFLKEGGLPELYHLPNEETKRHYLSSLRDTVLLRDVIQRHQIKDPALLLDIFTYLSTNLSTLVSINNLVNYFKSKNRKTTYDTIANYINYILQTFTVHRCERYDVKGKEIVGGNSKYYLNDLSFKNYLYSGNRHGFGYELENLVYLTLTENGFIVYVGYMRDKEVDFVALKEGKRLYIQVTFSLESENTAVREYSSLLSIADNFEKWVVSLDEFSYVTPEGIKHVPVVEFSKALESWV